MRCKVIADVRGRLVPPKSDKTLPGHNIYSVTDGDVTIAFARETNPDRMVISIERPLGTSDLSDEKNRKEMFAKASTALAEARERGKALEALLGFVTREGVVDRIDWASPKVDLIPETDNERRFYPTYFSRGRMPERPWTFELREEAFTEAVRLSPHCGDFIIPLAFEKEGGNHFARGQLRQAFCEFFFVLEGFYGDGKTGKLELKRAFAKSTELREVCADFCRIWLNGSHPRDRFAQELQGELLKAFKKERCDLTPEGVQTFLVEMRGRIHHFSQKSKSRFAHPLNENQFEGATWTARWIVGGILQERVDAARRVAGLTEGWYQRSKKGQQPSR